MPPNLSKNMLPLYCKTMDDALYVLVSRRMWDDFFVVIGNKAVLLCFCCKCCAENKRCFNVILFVAGCHHSSSSGQHGIRNVGNLQLQDKFI